MKKLSIDDLKRISKEEFKHADKTGLILILDNVRSLNNIGSIFRTSDAFRIESIYLCGITATPPNNEIHKTALGATETVHWEYFDKTEDAVGKARMMGYKIIGIEQVAGSTYLDEFIPTPNVKYALIFGHEIKGVQQQVINICDTVIEIPQFGTKHSFNISVSAGIVIWDIYTKMMKIKKGD